MPGVSFVFVGKMREAYYSAAFAEYIKRIGGYTKCDVREIGEQRLGERPSEREIAAALAREAREIEKAIPKGAYVCALCVEGDMCSSEDVAERLRRLDERADWRLSMSRMTFPHHLARVMLAEQVYRAFTINAGTGYHK